MNLQKHHLPFVSSDTSKECKRHNMQYQVHDKDLVYCVLTHHTCIYQSGEKKIHYQIKASKDVIRIERYYACNYGTLEEKVDDKL